jgi:hypothetical protein
MAARAVMAVLRGEGLHGSEMMELLHLLRHVGHALKEESSRFSRMRRRSAGDRRIHRSAADLALFFVGISEDAMLLALSEVRSNLDGEHSETFDADIAAIIAQAFVSTVVLRRRELDTTGATPRVLN